MDVFVGQRFHPGPGFVSSQSTSWDGQEVLNSFDPAIEDVGKILKAPKLHYS
jgi:hypothetical protein